MPHVPSFRAAVGDALSRWAVESQQAARRNAMRASTDLAAIRKERVDVEDFLAGDTATAPTPPTSESPEPPVEGPRRAHGGL